VVLVVEALTVGLLVCRCVLVIIDLLNSRIVSILYIQFCLVLLLGIGAHIHVAIHGLFVIFWKPFFAWELTVFLGILFKEGLWGWWLALIIINITCIFHVLCPVILTLLQTFLIDLDSSWSIVSLVIGRVGIYAASSFNQR